jgi:hypothetical protein
MEPVRKGLFQRRSKLKLQQALREGGSSHRDPSALSAAAPPPPARRPRASNDSLQELLAKSLWPMVEAAFRDIEEHIEARVFRLDDMQVVISRPPARDETNRDAKRTVTLELWPPAGPRVLVVEWSGRRPYIVHRRDGDWLQRLARISSQSQ